MDFSAFLGLPMQKKDETPKLRPVDEGPEAQVSGADELLASENQEKVRLEVRDRSEMKFRTHEPKLEEFVGPQDVTLEDEWNTSTTRSEPTRRSKAFWISVAVIVAAGMGWLVFEISRLKQQEQEVLIDTQSLLEKEEQAEIDARQTIDTIKDVVRKFYAAGSSEEILRCVRHADRVGESVRKYYTDHPLKPAEVTAVVDMTPLTIGTSGGFWVVLTKLNTGEDGKLVVEVYSPTEAKVDWETHVCAQPMEWDRFVKDRPAGLRGDFRVYVEMEKFYNYEFSDSNKYQAYKLTTLGSDEVMYGYALRDGQAYRAIHETFSQNTILKVPLLLRLHLQEGLQSKSGVLIEEVVSPRWLLVESPEVGK